jgi:hypothetical protein
MHLSKIEEERLEGNLHHRSLRSLMWVLLLLLLLLETSTDEILKLVELAHHILALLSQLFILSSQTRHFLTEISGVVTLVCSLSLHSSALLSIFLSLLSATIYQLSCISVNTAKMLVQIFLSRKALSRETLAVGMWAVQLFSWTSVQVVNLALMSQETA